MGGELRQRWNASQDYAEGGLAIVATSLQQLEAEPVRGSLPQQTGAMHGNGKRLHHHTL